VNPLKTSALRPLDARILRWSSVVPFG
jgi:hypothetical protein